MRDLEEAKKYHNMSPETLKHLQTPIRGPRRFFPIAVAATGVGAGWYYLKRQQNPYICVYPKSQGWDGPAACSKSSVVSDENHSDPMVVPEDSKKNDAKIGNN